MKFKPGDIITRIDREKGGLHSHMGELILMVVGESMPKDIPATSVYKPTGYWSCIIIRSPRPNKVGQMLQCFGETLDTQYRKKGHGISYES